MTVTPQNVLLAQNVITVAAKFNTNKKCNNMNAKFVKLLTQNVITEIVVTPQLQVCSTQAKVSNSIVTLTFWTLSYK